MAAKESSKLCALVRTPSMEHDLPEDVVDLAPDKSNSPLKKKKKKKIRESCSSGKRKKDKKKKSKKNKKESKPKKSRNARKRKGSESETNADNDIDEESESNETEVDMKRSRKKSKKDKKKRRYKRKEMSSSDETKSMSVSNKIGKNPKCETLNDNTYYDDYQSRSRSREKLIKPKKLQRDSNEPSQKRSGQSNSLKNKRRSHSNSYINKNVSNNRKEDLNLKYSSRSRDDESCDRNGTPCCSKHEGNRKSRSPLRSRHETIEENVKNLKRKRNEQHIYRKEESSGTDKRKRYSQSHSLPNTGESCEKISMAETEEHKSNSYKCRPRTPNRKRSDYRSKAKTSLSRSSSRKSSLKNNSLSPISQTSKKDESFKYENNINNLKKDDIIVNKNKDNICIISRSRSISRSSHTTSITNTRISKSRTPSPKKEYLGKVSTSNNIDSQTRKEQKLNLSNSVRTPTERRSTSIAQSRNVINEKGRIDNKTIRPSKESFGYRNEKGDEKSRTPPRTEKKILSPRSSRDSSELSYSPARRNPERYRDILENTKNEKRKIGENLEDRIELEWDRKEKVGRSEINTAKPVVRLHSQSDEDIDASERNTENILDEFQEYKRERELNELKLLEHLKTGLAAKAKEKIKTIEKMAASTSENMLTNNDGETSDKPHKRTVRNSLNEFLAANNVTPALIATCSPCTYNATSNSPLKAIYPQTFDEIKKEQEAALHQIENVNSFDNNKDSKKGFDTMTDCKKSSMTANIQTTNVSPISSPFRNSVNVPNKERDRKRERDLRERERERENYNFNKDRYLERRPKSISGFYSTGGGGVGGGAICAGNMGGGRRNTNSNILNINHRQRLNIMCNSGIVAAHHHSHSHLHPHHHHPNHKIINNHHNSPASSFFLTNNSTNPHNLLYNHSNNSTNIAFNRPSRINNTPLITATQFNNQMLSKQSNSILVNRRDHRTALNLGLSGTPCTNFSNSNLLLTKANINAHHLHAAAVGHVVGGGHHHHHHHHSQNAGMSSGGSSSATQITDRILMAASLAAAQRHSFGVHSTVSNAAAVAAANNLNFLHQQNTQKLVIKPFKINDSQPLVTALADSSLVDAIVSKVSTATVAAAESAARRSRSRSRRSRSRNHHDEKNSATSNSGVREGDGNRHHSQSRSRSSSSTSSRSRGRSHSHRSSRSRSSQTSSTTHSSSRSSSSSSFGTSRSGTRSPSIPRRRGSPSFLDRRRITSARKRPIPYHRKLSSDASSCYCSSCCSRESSPHSRSPSRDSRSSSRLFET